MIGAAIGTAIEVGKQIYDGGNWNWDPSTWNYWEIGIGALIGSSAVGVGGAVVGGVIGYVIGGTDDILSGTLTGFGIGAIVGFIIGGCIGLNTWNADVRMARQFLTDNGVDAAYHDNLINSFKC